MTNTSAHTPSAPPETRAHAPLLDIYEQMIGGVRMAEILTRVTRVVQQALHVERATIYVLREPTQELESIITVGMVARPIRVPVAKSSLAGFCALTGRSLIVPDVHADLSHIDPEMRFDASWDRINRFRTRDVMCAPALFGEQVVGVVQGINSTRRSFDQNDLNELAAMARLVGYALYHARLYDELASLKRLDQEKAEFMRIMVHELKAPVAAGRTLVEGLRFAHRDDPQIEGVTGKIANRMDQLLALVEDILELSRIKSAKPLGEVTVLDAAEQLRRLIDPYAQQAADKGLRFEVDLPAAPVLVRFDEKGFELVLSNLLSNAVKYTLEGFVRIEMEVNREQVTLRVSDTGIGIPPAEVPHLFGEFFRASNARRSGIRGSGVGLAGVKQLVERFNGQLELETGQYPGSTFTVHLPIHQHDS